MPRHVLVSATIKEPIQFRDIFSLLASVNPVCSLSITSSAVTICAVDTKRTYQMWVHLEPDLSFENFQLDGEQFLEMSASSISRVFRSYDGVNDVIFRIDRRSGSSRSILLKTNNYSLEGSGEMIVRQKMMGKGIIPEDLPKEPNVGNLDIYCELPVKILSQLARVSDKYRHMNANVTVQINRDGILTLISEPKGALITTSWPVELHDIDLSQGIDPDGYYPGNEFKATVSAKDWADLLQARNVARRIVVAVGQSRVVAVYCYLRSTTDHSIFVFYLSSTV